MERSRLGGARFVVYEDNLGGLTIAASPSRSAPCAVHDMGGWHSHPEPMTTSIQRSYWSYRGARGYVANSSRFASIHSSTSEQPQYAKSSLVKTGDRIVSEPSRNRGSGRIAESLSASSSGKGQSDLILNSPTRNLWASD